MVEERKQIGIYRIKDRYLRNEGLSERRKKKLYMSCNMQLAELSSSSIYRTR